LIQALKDNDSIVRADAAGALGKIKDTRAVEPLIQVLKDSDFIVRMGAATALWRIKGYSFNRSADAGSQG
jgi:HEAT repeat protein